MGSEITSVVKLLSEAEILKAPGLPVEKASPIHPEGSILEPLCAVLEEIVAVVEAQRVQGNITDWPFEHFWINPFETRHSKLLGYFINPDERHGCGSFLLQKFLQTLGSEDGFPFGQSLPVDGCRVAVESDYIDLLITRDFLNGKYAIIIENKVNGASNQPRQLQTYVENVMGRGFKADEICVFYLPRGPHQHPDKDDLNAVRNHGAYYKQITFEAHILQWLDGVLNEEAGSEWPDNMRRGMRDNLSHYRNLVAYLVNQQKEMSVDEQILGRIQAADANGLALDLATVRKLTESSAGLQRCLESTLRAKLLLKVQSTLKEQGIESHFYSSGGLAVPPPLLTSPYDQRFEHEKNLCVKVNDAVMVCFGGYAEESPGYIFYEGCMRSGDGETQAEQERVVLAMMHKRLPNPMTNLPWYAWGWKTDVNYNNCQDDATIARIAKNLIDMRDQLKSLVP